MVTLQKRVTKGVCGRVMVFDFSNKKLDLEGNKNVTQKVIS